MCLRVMVAEYDGTEETKGAVLRRERLYDSHIQEWRAGIEVGLLDDPPRRGRTKRPGRTTEQARIAELERQVTRLTAQFGAAGEAVARRDEALDVLGKGVEFLEALSSKNVR